MDRNKKILEIRSLILKNIATVNDIKLKDEEKSIMFCLFIGDKIASVDVQKTFIDSKTIEEIKSHFSNENIYHSILGDKMCDHGEIFVTPFSQLCREMYQQ